MFTDVSTDQSLIFEILEYDPSIPNENIAKYHFDEIATLNDASDQSQIFSIEPVTDIEDPNFPPNTYKCILFGRQMVSKYRESCRNTVNMYLFVIRLPSFNTEILITFNDPVAIHPESSSAHATPVGANVTESVKFFTDVIRSFKINDWSLFQDDDSSAQ
eukprot:GEZU01016660.1.p1 GENE.GEZU01016660.1~~GEZU01016660.1.p1  ORF type:complete len:160 (+),score=26.60 GEZU01016660.1:56-535(+)